MQFPLKCSAATAAHRAKAATLSIIPDMVGQLLAERSVQIESASNGLEALHIIQRQPPNAILLDLMMPELDGFELLAQLRAHPDHREIPVIVLTAKNLSRQDVQRLQQGVVQVIEKQGLEANGLVTALLRRLS